MMQHKLSLSVFLFSLAVAIILIPACARKSTQPAPAAPVIEEDEATKQARAEEERLKAETEARELRAAKIKFMYENIQFKKGSYALTSEANQILMRKAAWLHDHPDVTVIIEGHTDERGSKEYNIALGDRRAGEVKSFLIRQGIATERLIAVSYGKEKPIDPNRTEAAKMKNRRVHFVIE
jgi:peptidoglycan-associated lipoprotein